MSRKISDLLPELQDKHYNGVLPAAEKRDLKLIPTFTSRTFVEQDGLFALGRTKPGHIITKALAGWSIHNFNGAIDYAIVQPDKTIDWSNGADANKNHISDWEELGEIAEEAGLTWGGNWKRMQDLPHMQLKDFKRIDCQIEKLPELVAHTVKSPLYSYHVQYLLKKLKMYHGAHDGIIGRGSKQALQNIGLSYTKANAKLIDALWFRFFSLHGKVA